MLEAFSRKLFDQNVFISLKNQKYSILLPLKLSDGENWSFAVALFLFLLLSVLILKAWRWQINNLSLGFQMSQQSLSSHTECQQVQTSVTWSELGERERFCPLTPRPRPASSHLLLLGLNANKLEIFSLFPWVYIRIHTALFFFLARGFDSKVVNLNLQICFQSLFFHDKRWRRKKQKLDKTWRFREKGPLPEGGGL